MNECVCVMCVCIKKREGARVCKRDGERMREMERQRQREGETETESQCTHVCVLTHVNEGGRITMG